MTKSSGCLRNKSCELQHPCRTQWWVIPVGSVPKARHGRGVQRRCAILGAGTCQGGNGTEVQRNLRVAGTWPQATTPVSDGVGLPDLTNKNIGHPVKLEFQIDNKYFYVSCNNGWSSNLTWCPVFFSGNPKWE